MFDIKHKKMLARKNQYQVKITAVLIVRNYNNSSSATWHYILARMSMVLS